MAKTKKEEGNKVLINSGVLSKALKEVGIAVETSVILPINSNVHCTATKDSLKLMSTDMALTIVTKIQCECSGDFTFLMPFKEIHRMMSAIPDQPIEIIIAENITLKIGRGIEKLGVSEKVEFFPKKKELDNKYTFKADKSFLNAMNMAIKCVLGVSMGSIFENVCLHGDGKMIYIVSCDKHQLFRYKDEISGAKMKTMVGTKFIKAINQLEEAEISGNDEYILAKSGDVEIIARLPEGTYVDYSHYYPPYKPNISLAAKDLAAVMNKILSYDNKVHECILELKDQTLFVKYHDEDFDRHSENEVDAEHQKDIAPVCVDCSNLKNLLSIIKSDKVAIYIEATEMPIHVDSEDENLNLIIMPLAKQN